MKRLALLAAVLLLFAAIDAFAAVGYDISTSTAGISVTSISWTHTITGSNPTLICAISVWDYNSLSDSLASVQYNSADMNIASVLDTSSGTGGIWLIMAYAVAPAAGAHTFYFEWPSAVNMLGTCTSFTGAHQTTPMGAAQTALALDPGIASVTVPANGMAFDSGLNFQGACDALTPGDGGQTGRINANANCGDVDLQMVGSTRTTTGAFFWDTTSAPYQGLIAVPINPAAVGGAVVRHRPVIQ